MIALALLYAGTPILIVIIITLFLVSMFVGYLIHEFFIYPNCGCGLCKQGNETKFGTITYED